MNLFQEIINHFQSNTQYEKFIKQSEKEYDIKMYKLSHYSVGYAQQIIKELTQKYKLGKITPQPTGWNENEKKLFVWFIISFLNYKMLDIIDLIDGCQRYWKVISTVFWNKQIPFLKYQVSNLIKAKSRAIWKEEQQYLLIQGYQKYKMGDWNQIAKYIYFNSGCQIFKTPKQCRQRWQNHLNKQVLKGSWTEQQTKFILSYVKQNGKKWAQINRNLQNKRTQHMIKNRYQSIIKKQLNRKDSRSNNEQQALDNLLKDYQIVIQYYQSQILQDQNNHIQQNFERLQGRKIKRQQQIAHQFSKSNRSNENNLNIDGCNISFSHHYKKNNINILNNQSYIKLDSSLKNFTFPTKGFPNQIVSIAYSSVHSMHSGLFNSKQINLQNSLNVQDFGLKGSSSFCRINLNDSIEKDFSNQSNKFD